MITHYPHDDMGNPDSGKGPAGNAVFDSIADTLRYVQRVVRRILAEPELAATARLSASEVPAAGNAVLIAVLALIVATAALAVAIRTRRYRPSPGSCDGLRRGFANRPQRAVS